MKFEQSPKIYNNRETEETQDVYYLANNTNLRKNNWQSPVPMNLAEPYPSNSNNDFNHSIPKTMESSIMTENREKYLNDSSSDIACIKANILKAIEILENEYSDHNAVPSASISSNERLEHTNHPNIQNRCPSSFQVDKSSRDLLCAGSANSANQECLVLKNMSCKFLANNNNNKQSIGTQSDQFCKHVCVAIHESVAPTSQSPLDCQYYKKTFNLVQVEDDDDQERQFVRDLPKKNCDSEYNIISQNPAFPNRTSNENYKNYAVSEIKNDRKHTACKSCNVSSYISHIAEINKLLKAFKTAKENDCRNGIKFGSKQYTRPNKENKNRLKSENTANATSIYHKCYLDEILQSIQKSKCKGLNISEMPDYKNNLPIHSGRGRIYKSSNLSGDSTAYQCSNKINSFPEEIELPRQAMKKNLSNAVCFVKDRHNNVDNLDVKVKSKVCNKMFQSRKISTGSAQNPSMDDITEHRTCSRKKAKERKNTLLNFSDSTNGKLVKSKAIGTYNPLETILNNSPNIEGKDIYQVAIPEFQKINSVDYINSEGLPKCDLKYSSQGSRLHKSEYLGDNLCQNVFTRTLGQNHSHYMFDDRGSCHGEQHMLKRSQSSILNLVTNWIRTRIINKSKLDKNMRFNHSNDQDHNQKKSRLCSSNELLVSDQKRHQSTNTKDYGYFKVNVSTCYEENLHSGCEHVYQPQKTTNSRVYTNKIFETCRECSIKTDSALDHIEKEINTNTSNKANFESVTHNKNQYETRFKSAQSSLKLQEKLKNIGCCTYPSVSSDNDAHNVYRDWLQPVIICEDIGVTTINNVDVSVNTDLNVNNIRTMKNTKNQTVHKNEETEIRLPRSQVDNVNNEVTTPGIPKDVGISTVDNNDIVVVENKIMSCCIDDIYVPFKLRKTYKNVSCCTTSLLRENCMTYDKCCGTCIKHNCDENNFENQAKLNVKSVASYKNCTKIKNVCQNCTTYLLKRQTKCYDVACHSNNTSAKYQHRNSRCSTFAQGKRSNTNCCSHCCKSIKNCNKFSKLMKCSANRDYICDARKEKANSVNNVNFLNMKSKVNEPLLQNSLRNKQHVILKNSTTVNKRTGSDIAIKRKSSDQLVEFVRSIIEKYYYSPVTSKIHYETYKKSDKPLNYDNLQTSKIESLAENYISNVTKNISTNSSTLTEESAPLTAVTPILSEEKIIFHTVTDYNESSQIKSEKLSLKKDSVKNTFCKGSPLERSKYQRKNETKGGMYGAYDLHEEDSLTLCKSVPNCNSFHAHTHSFNELSRTGALQKSNCEPKQLDTEYEVFKLHSDRTGTVLQKITPDNRCLYKSFEEYLHAIARHDAEYQCESITKCCIKESIPVQHILSYDEPNSYIDYCKSEMVKRDCCCNTSTSCCSCQKDVMCTCNFSCHSNDLCVCCICPNHVDKSTGVKTKPRIKKKILYEIKKKLFDKDTNCECYTDRSTNISKEHIHKKHYRDIGVKTSKENIEKKMYVDKSMKTSKENIVKKCFMDTGVKTSEESIHIRFYSDKNSETSEKRPETKFFTETSREHFISIINVPTRRSKCVIVKGIEMCKENIQNKCLKESEIQEKEDNIFCRIKNKIVDIAIQTLDGHGNSTCKCLTDESTKTSILSTHKSAEISKKESEKKCKVVKLPLFESSECVCQIKKTQENQTTKDIKYFNNETHIPVTDNFKDKRKSMQLCKTKSSFCWKVSKRAKDDSKLKIQRVKIINSELLTRRHLRSNSHHKKQVLPNEMCKRSKMKQIRDKYLKFHKVNQYTNKKVYKIENYLYDYDSEYNNQLNFAVNPMIPKFSTKHLGAVRPFCLEHSTQIARIHQSDELCQQIGTEIDNNDLLRQCHITTKKKTTRNMGLKPQSQKNKGSHSNYKIKSKNKLNDFNVENKKILTSNNTKNFERNVHKCITFPRRNEACPLTSKIFGLNRLRSLYEDVKSKFFFVKENETNSYNKVECNHRNDASYNHHENLMRHDTKSLLQSQITPTPSQTKERREYQKYTNSWSPANRRSKLDQLTKSTSLHLPKSDAGKDISVQVPPLIPSYFKRQKVKYQDPNNSLNKSIQTSKPVKKVKVNKKHFNKSNYESLPMHHRKKKISSKKNTLNNKKSLRSFTENDKSWNGFTYCKQGKRYACEGDYERYGKLYKALPGLNHIQGTENSSVTLLYSKDKRNFDSCRSNLSVKHSSCNSCESITLKKEKRGMSYYSQVLVPYEGPKRGNTRRSSLMDFEDNINCMYVPKKSLSFDMYQRNNSRSFNANLHSKHSTLNKRKKSDTVSEAKVNPCDKKFIYGRTRIRDPGNLDKLFFKKQKTETNASIYANDRMDCLSKKFIKIIQTGAKTNNSKSMKIPLNDHQEMKITISTRNGSNVKSGIVTPCLQKNKENNTTDSYYSYSKKNSVNSQRFNKPRNVKSRKVQSCLNNDVKPNPNVKKYKKVLKIPKEETVASIKLKSRNNDLHSHKTQTDRSVIRNKRLQSCAIDDKKSKQTSTNFFQRFKSVVSLNNKKGYIRYSRSCDNNNTNTHRRVDKSKYNNVQPYYSKLPEPRIGNKKMLLDKPGLDLRSDTTLNKGRCLKNARFDRERRIEPYTYCVQAVKHDVPAYVNIKSSRSITTKCKRKKRSKCTNVQQEPPCEKDWFPLCTGDNQCNKESKREVHKSRNFHKTKCETAQNTCIHPKGCKYCKQKIELNCKDKAIQSENKPKSLFRKLFSRFSNTKSQCIGQVKLDHKKVLYSKTKCANFNPRGSCQQQNRLLRMFAGCKSQQFKSCTACKKIDSSNKCKPHKLCDTCHYKELEDTCNYVELLKQPNPFLTMGQIRKYAHSCCLNGLTFLFCMPVLFCFMIFKCISCKLCN